MMKLISQYTWSEMEKTIYIQKRKIANLEERIKALSSLRVNKEVPLEVLLEQSSYKHVWDEGYEEGEAQARDIAAGAPLHEKRITYSAILESGKRYVVNGGILSLFALKIMEGKGLFEFTYQWANRAETVFTFTAIPEEKYVLMERAFIVFGGVTFEVKEIEGHIRYVLAMSAFLDYEIKEVSE